MRNLRNSGLVHDTNYAKHPFGSIQDETASKQGTPVVREVYNDILMNLYKILEDRGIDFNNLEDDEDNGYQLVQALKVWVNELNDTERVLTRGITTPSSQTWNLDINFNFVVDKYVLFARASDDYDDSKDNFLSSTIAASSTTYEIESAGFLAGDELLIVMDFAKVRIYKISSIVNPVQQDSTILTIHGNPISHSTDFDSVWFLNDGILFSSSQKSLDLFGLFATEYSTNTVRDVVLINGCFVVSCWDSNISAHRIFGIRVDDLNTIFEFDVEFPSAGGVFRDMLMVAVVDENSLAKKLRFTHAAGSHDVAHRITEATIDFEDEKIINLTDFVYDSDFENTSNIVGVSSGVYFMNGSNLYFCNQDKTDLVVENIPIYGRLFALRDKIYYSNGEVAEQWLREI